MKTIRKAALAAVAAALLDAPESNDCPADWDDAEWGAWL
jgi:hypothetical protein